MLMLGLQGPLTQLQMLIFLMDLLILQLTTVVVSRQASLTLQVISHFSYEQVCPGVLICSDSLEMNMSLANLHNRHIALVFWIKMPCYNRQPGDSLLIGCAHA